MQVFVYKVDLSAGDDSNVRIHGWYPDVPTMPSNFHGDAAVPIFLPANAIVVRASDQMRLLVSTWRDSASMIVNGEAGRRINDVFPDYQQRNSNSEMNGYITQYGADSTQWPAAEQARKAENDRMWSYVNDVRQTSDALVLSMPADPTDDSHWPTRVPPYDSGP
jgi:hypothetical protein